MNRYFEYATLEWIWNANTIRIDYPGNQTEKAEGEHPEVVAKLTELGRQGWEVASCAAAGNWLFWTLKREISPQTGSRHDAGSPPQFG